MKVAVRADSAQVTSSVRLYLRGLALLAEERGLAISLALAGVLVAGLQLAEPVLFGRIVDGLAHGGSGASRWIVLWAGLGLFGICASVCLSVLSDRLAHRRECVVLRDAFEHAIGLSASDHARSGSGAVVRTLTAGSDSLFWIWLPTLREQLPALCTVLFLLPTGLVIDVRMSAILIVLAAAYTLSNVYVLNKTDSGQRAIERQQNDVSSRLSDVVSNVTVVQGFTRMSAEIDALRDLLAAVLSARYPVLTWWGVLVVLQRGAATITMVAMLALGVVLLRRGELSVGEIVSFTAFANLLIGKLDQLSSFVLRTHQGLAPTRSLFALLDTQPSVIDRPGAHALPVVHGAVRYESVSFRYPGTEAPGVFDLSFEAAAGTTTALVGPTGSGKSTTLAFLQRWIEPQHGRVLIDEHDILDLQVSSLRAAIAVVYQESGLFNRSIAENIAIGKPGASQQEIEQAARLAEADEFAREKPGGYGFVIGERGAALSGGERQRLAIARAILKNAPILILDEATSALDTETEAKIKRALVQLRRGRTTFLIAHRLSTIASADQILVIERGRIVERGSYAELEKQGGTFARLVASGSFSVAEPNETTLQPVGAGPAPRP
jgi:glucan exporter ATP-binding protein